MTVPPFLISLTLESWLESGGLLLLAAIVFAESGLLIGFFLPGDSLLFILMARIGLNGQSLRKNVWSLVICL